MVRSAITIFSLVFFASPAFAQQVCWPMQTGVSADGSAIMGQTCMDKGAAEAVAAGLQVSDTCNQVHMPDEYGNVKIFKNCYDSFGHVTTTESSDGVNFTQVPSETDESQTYNSAYTDNSSSDRICIQETGRVNRENATLPKVVGAHVELRPLRVDCARRLVTGDIRLLLSSSEISSNINLKNTLVTAQRDAACSESFVAQHGWTAETNYYDQNFAYVDRVVTRQQDCHTAAASQIMPAPPSTPQNMQELSEAMDGTLKGLAGDVLGGMIRGIFDVNSGSGNNSGGRTPASCPPRRDCSDGRCIVVRDC